MKKLWYTKIIKANGLIAYYGKRNTEVFPSKGIVDAEDSSVGYETEDGADKNQRFIENFCRTMGILTTDIGSVTLCAE